MKVFSQYVKIFLLSFAILSMFALPIKASAANDPVAMLKSIADRMIEGLNARKATLQTNPALVYSLANRLIVPYADLEEMSKRVLPARTWSAASPAQRAQFKREFTITLERTYATALAEYKDETVRFYPVRGGYEGRADIKVDSQIIRSEGPSIGVGYRLVLKGSQWRLYDMIVEGVSMLESFRAQFSDILSRGDIQEVIQQLRTHNSTRS